MLKLWRPGRLTVPYSPRHGGLTDATLALSDGCVRNQEHTPGFLRKPPRTDRGCAGLRPELTLAVRIAGQCAAAASGNVMPLTMRRLRTPH